MSEPSTPRQRRSAVSEPSSRLRPLKTPRLRPRVVTQQNFFFASALRSARLLRSPRDLSPQPGTLLLPACRQAVRNVQDRERKWLFRGTLDGRKKRSFEYQAARQRRVPQQGSITNPSPLRAPPD